MPWVTYSKWQSRDWILCTLRPCHCLSMSGKAPWAGLAPEFHILCLAGPHDPHDEKSKHFCDLCHSHLACEIGVCELRTEC